MAIYLFSGVPGSGKSLHIVKECLFRLKHNDRLKIISNFDMNLEPYNNRVYRFDAFTFSPKILCDFILDKSGGAVEPSSFLIVWDEAQNVFNTRTWNDKNRLDWLKWFTTSRHWGCDVILCAQQKEMLDKQIRGIIEINVRHYKLASVFKHIGALLFWLPIFCWFSSYATNYKIKLDHGFLFGSSKLFDRYDSFTLRLSSSDGVEGIQPISDYIVI